jgi:hypothetical protein
MTSITFTPEQDQYLQLAQTRAYYQGIREGLERYAHWSNGTQYVGTTGRTLREAIQAIDQEEQSLLDKYTLA